MVLAFTKDTHKQKHTHTHKQINAPNNKKTYAVHKTHVHVQHGTETQKYVLCSDKNTEKQKAHKPTHMLAKCRNKSTHMLNFCLMYIHARDDKTFQLQQ